MLFARFLAENNLLMYPDPDEPVAVTLEECEDLAADEGANNGWELAARYASKMLPQIFRLVSPVFKLIFPPEYQIKLESLLGDLPKEIFTASDSLGWVYQYWQNKRKKEVNDRVKSGDSVGSRELPSVTQFFTEPYMVKFLLHNTLGAWWAKKHLTKNDLQKCYPDTEGYRTLPEMNIACSGLSIASNKKEWLSLAGDDTNLSLALDTLYNQFNNAPVLGSLINPLGGKAFTTPIGADVMLIILSKGNNSFCGIDITESPGVEYKSRHSINSEISILDSNVLASHSDARITIQHRDLQTNLLEEYATCFAGILNGDTPIFVTKFWEVIDFGNKWNLLQSTVKEESDYGGRSNVILWENGVGQLRQLAIELKERLHDADRRGNQAWGKKGIAISQMGDLPACIYSGDYFDSNAAVILPEYEKNVLPIWTFCSSTKFNTEVRKIDKKKRGGNFTR
ncbi:MAG: hypothetical protein U9N77_14305, partial [Thermodesulfobacteriota bacterium]|nr:hypothetical protein [Thermodesulfobacteriota bacterium]